MTLTNRQLDGFACIACGSESGRMRPVGFGPRGQLFECAQHTEARAVLAHESAPASVTAEGEGLTEAPTKQKENDQS